MTLSECYRLLELTSGASAEEVKTSYRRLVRRYHPDVNPDKPEWAKAKFIELTHAYESITRALQSAVQSSFNASSSQEVAHSRRATVPVRSPKPQAPSPATPEPKPPVSEPSPFHIQSNPALSDVDNQLKKTSYRQLQEFLKDKRFA
ncbi:MAG: DnaJ domain-containing protein, partial [Leptolyngbyaceae bacterium]|nr:DnaJ domain-containing protein [Leptolyngbyaceae bacterium]